MDKAIPNADPPNRRKPGRTPAQECAGNGTLNKRFCSAAARQRGIVSSTDIFQLNKILHDSASKLFSTARLFLYSSLNQAGIDIYVPRFIVDALRRKYLKNQHF